MNDDISFSIELTRDALRNHGMLYGAKNKEGHSLKASSRAIEVRGSFAGTDFMVWRILDYGILVLSSSNVSSCVCVVSWWVFFFHH
jgi:hypothetical protein